MSDATIITLNAALRAVMPALQIEWRFFLHFNSKEHEVLLLRKLKVHDMIVHIRIAIACLLLLLTSLYLNAQTITWQKVYGDTGEDVGLSIAQVFDGGYVMCGPILPPYGNRIIRTDKFGSVIWNIARDGFPLNKIIQTSDSNFVLVGYSREFVSNSLQGYVVKIDTSGNLIWWREYGAHFRQDVFNDALITNDGSLMIVGSFDSAMYLIKLDSSGNRVWDKTYDTTGQGLNIHEIKGKGFLLTGSTALYVDYEGNVKYSSPNLGIDGVSAANGNRFLFLDRDMRVIVTDSTLNEVSRFWITMPGKSLYGNNIIRYGENYVVGGESITNNINADEDAYLVKFDISGKVIWNGNIPARFEFNECMKEVSVSSDSGFIAVGFTSHFIGTTDFLAIKMDRMGNTDPVSILENGLNESLSYTLSQNYPNPFNSTTVISYSLSIDSHVELSLVDVLGRKVITLVNRFMKEGHHEFLLSSNSLPSGVYFYSLYVDGKQIGVKRMALVK